MTKTNKEIERLVHNVLFHPHFNLQDLTSYSSEHKNLYLDGLLNKLGRCISVGADHLREGSVKIKLPSKDGRKQSKGKSYITRFKIKGKILPAHA